MYTIEDCGAQRSFVATVADFISKKYSFELRKSECQLHCGALR